MFNPNSFKYTPIPDEIRTLQETLDDLGGGDTRIATGDAYLVVDDPINEQV